jgi:hypothetical protein
MSTRDDLNTAGERLVGRRLEAEIRAGVPHYVPGQHDARIYPWSTAWPGGEPIQVGRVTYVDVGGHACVLLVARDTPDGDWRPTWIGRAGHHYAEQAIPAPANFIISPGMYAALRDADLRGPDPIGGA